jgi:uncharacterized protein (DUF1499 family)
MGWLPPRINDIQTGRTPQYPEVQPLHVKRAPDDVFSAAAKLAGSQNRWTVVKVDPQSRTLAAEARSKLWRFVDDVTITVEEEPGGSVVNMRSRSRLGKSDFGVNAKRITSFLRRLARALESNHG